jgi:Ca2+-binding RTX toxin-like protein
MATYGTRLRDILHGGIYEDEIYGNDGNDTIYGHESNDWLSGEGDNDTLYGGTGLDTLLGGGGVDHLYGGADNDTLVGGAGVDYLYGEGDNDWLYGGLDDDFLYGGAGVDHLYGNENNDWLNGGDGADYLYGDAGIDTAAYGDSDATVFVSLVTGRGFGGDAERDILSGIENLSGSRFADLLVGDDQNNVLSGLGGSDSLLGGNGGDRLNGGGADDTLNGGGNIHRIVLGGSSIIERVGDVLTGDAGADKFVFSSIEDIGNYTVHSISINEVDFITDFNPAEGDRIDLRPIDADTSTPGNQDFSTTFIPEGAAFTAPGQISLSHWAGDTLIVLNTDVYPSADATIRISGWYDHLEASWFM